MLEQLRHEETNFLKLLHCILVSIYTNVLFLCGVISVYQLYFTVDALSLMIRHQRWHSSCKTATPAVHKSFHIETFGRSILAHNEHEKLASLIKSKGIV